MKNKNAKKNASRKRKLSNRDDDPKKIEICSAKIAHIEENGISDAEVLEILPTREVTANQLVNCLKQKEFVVIEGPMGSGKSFIARFAAQELGISLHTMQMGDQVDSKGLLGSYHTTEIAGQFHWKPSNFSKWLSQPCAILVEDIDMANQDVIALLASISTSRTVTLPSGDDLHFHEKVVLMATISGRGKKNSTIEAIPAKISLQSLTDADLRRLVAKAFPRASHLSTKLTAMFRELESVAATSNSRQLTSADLLKACARIDKLVDLSHTTIFPELIDVWCLTDESSKRAHILCEKIAESLTITPDQLSFHLNLRQPTLSYDDVACTIGRSKLSRNASLSLVQKHRLGHTRDVLQLMERIAVSVQHCEPVLLVGETGVGKTSVVQSLASYLNVNLRVVNLSPTSDADDLIEGFKPVTIGRILEPFTHLYYDVFTSNFDKIKNSKFLGHLETCLSTGRYRDYLTVVENTAVKALQAPKKDSRWAEVLVRSRKIREGIEKNAAPFALTRGAVLEAAQEGDWLLVDEINLASPECLDAIIHAIDSAHPNFRLFACMNPATDAGKRRLPAGVRTRFTEFFVSEMCDPHQLALLVSTYLPSMKASVVENVVNFYLQAKEQYPSSYSLRTLCRALLFAADNLFVSDERNLREAISMAFLTNLSLEDKAKMRLKINQALRSGQSSQAIPPPPNDEDGHGHVQIEGYWIVKGKELPKEDSKFVMTKTVKENMAEIARIVCSGRFPILLEGETSAGKTSIVTHLAKVTGNSIVRINNHEHTDIQEYMGSYVADESGRLTFREGALVKAVRDGGWVILDELNLAPTDVIEALNRLLDDNRELFVPELNKVVKAHSRFRLFATQNPAGTYSGRKKLSRALLSRFVVLRFHHLPMDELSSMICTRCSVHSSAATKMIAVLSELRNKRSLTGLFSARDGLMTLRDVFRWAKRLSTDDTCDDWLQILANHGYFLLAGRCRNKKDEESVVETLERVLKRKIDMTALFASTSPYFPDIDMSNVVATNGMRRMVVMTYQAWLRDEAVLMVGETGGGKTTLAQLVSHGQLLTINCHERTETADLLGRLRPKEKGGFEWSDGIVIEAMKKGIPLLVDEISLAEDSVLERLNPLFEENRSLLLSDSGADVHEVVALGGYQMIATMNPGGDYGKKELSKALRNRFTEVWSSSDYTSDELVSIFNSRVQRVTPIEEKYAHIAQAVVEWISEFFGKYSHVFRHAPSVRDIVACADLFCAIHLESKRSLKFSIREAICCVFLDALSSLPTRMAIDPEAILQDALLMLSRMVPGPESESGPKIEIQILDDGMSIGPLHIKFGSLKSVLPRAFSLKAPTCISNFYRIARGLLINKPILLEGAPGCGKSSSVMALAKLTGNPITRLNLSDQTDLTDLFGTDVPVVLEDGNISFKWEDGPVLRAIKRGEWILLDEMNLASQSVLEGLNACFDHRRILFIAELNKSFEIPADSKCRFFACQNPRAQGGNRRALPKSFVNRFTNIWVDELTPEDISFILKEVDVCNSLTEAQLRAMVECNNRLAEDDHLFGGPFSFNLRDLLRWMHLFTKTERMSTAFHLLYVSRMRKQEDINSATQLYEEFFGEPCIPTPICCSVDEDSLLIGQTRLSRKKSLSNCANLLLSSHLPILNQIASCVDMNWLMLLIGSKNIGKRAAIESIASLTGNRVYALSLTSETDAQELIGSYEQIVDSHIIENTRNRLLNLFSASALSTYYPLLKNSTSLTEMEAALELLFSETTDSKLVEESRDLIEYASKNMMKFEWIDSAFVKAYVEGDWILLEDVNLCSGAVLDRLNCCLECDGTLVISERKSSFEPLKAHPNFRVFMTMDPKNGEVSRAMRNRSVEVYMSNEQSWSTSSMDLASMYYGFNGKVLPSQTAMALSTLAAERQLFSLILLRTSEISEVCRFLSLDPEFEQDDVTYLSAPRVTDVDTESFINWQLTSWKGNQRNILERILLCMSSASTHALTSDSMDHVFGSLASPFLQRVIPLVQSLSLTKHPLDGRFSGGHFFDSTTSRYTITLLCEWAIQSIGTIDIEDGSAEYMSKTHSKYELHTNEHAFKNVPLISALVAESIKMLQELSLDYSSEKQAIGVIFSLVHLIRACRGAIFSRSGSAPIYIAWNQCSDLHLILSPSLTKIVNLMKLGWSSEAHELFVSRYLKLYDQHRLLYPFDTEEENDCFLSHLDKNLISQHSCEEIPMETDEPTDSLGESTSVIAEPLLLVNHMHQMLTFFESAVAPSVESIFNSQQPLCYLKWREDDFSRTVRNITILNSQFNADGDMVVNIPRFGAFNHVYLSFWSSLKFDPTLSMLSIEDLRNFALTTFTNQLWRLAPNSTILSAKIRGALGNCASVFNGWSNILCSDNWESRVSFASEMLANALPPVETLDPVVFKEELYHYYEKKLIQISNQLEILEENRYVVSRQSSNMCDSSSDHPLIATLFILRKQLQSSMDNHQDEGCAVYRQKACLYSELCDGMRSFRSMVSEILHILKEVQKEDIAQFDADKARVRLAQLYSFTNSAASYRQSCLSKYSSFIDVTMTFLVGLDILLTSIHEVCFLLESQARRKELTIGTAFPPVFNLAVSENGLESSELLAWSCRDASPMPLALKSVVVRKRLTNLEDIGVGLEWTRQQWKKWYEKNIAKAAEKDFMYRTKTEEEKDELDVIEFFSKEEQDKEVLPSSDISLLLDATEKDDKRHGSIAEHDRDLANVRYSLALSWIRNLLTQMGLFPDNLHLATSYSDLAILSWISSREDSEQIIDVYRCSSIKEYRKAANLLDMLIARAVVVLNRWPEVVTLKLVISTAKEFIKAPVSNTQINMATMIENVIEKAEEWEKIADRENSLREELGPLREVLVEWKKMEVRSWTTLLDRSEMDSCQRAQLVAYPLFEALFNAESPEAKSALIAMTVEWLHNSTLVDFNARIRSINSLAEWANHLNKTHLSFNLLSVAAHFSQYLEVSQNNLKGSRDPAANSLKDYLRIVKYNDLNLWNIKVSSQKAHTHLFKIIRKFRDAVSFEVSPHFDSLLDIEKWSNIKRLVPLKYQMSTEFEGRPLKAYQLAQKIFEHDKLLTDVSSFIELCEQISSCDKELKTIINYDQFSEDTEKEKAQGYARNCRQRSVALVIKESQAVGISARKAMTLCQEKITQDSITAVTIGNTNEELVRACAGGRNAAIRKSNKPSDQLGVATKKHLSGVIELGMHWILRQYNMLSKFEHLSNKIKAARSNLERIQTNIENQWMVDHSRLQSRIDCLIQKCCEVTRVSASMSKVISMVPDAFIENADVSQLHPLSLLHREHSDLPKLTQSVSHLVTLSNDMKRIVISLKKEESHHYESVVVQSAFNNIFALCNDARISLIDVSPWFAQDTVACLSLLDDILSNIEISSIDIVDPDNSSSDTTPICVFIQELYKSLVEPSADHMSLKTLERFTKACDAIESCGVEKVIAWTTDFIEGANVGRIPSLKIIHEVTALIQLSDSLYFTLTSTISEGVRAFCVLYHSILSLAMQLFEKGYVNTIPKAEKQESGEGKTDESGEGGGMGEGKSAGDAKDVTDEMEETGQIEGLQDEELEDPSGDKGNNEKPIEMDEDFAEDLQDIDKNEGGNDEDDDKDDEEEEASPEDQMGEVEDQDDTQLDPKLWDEEEEKEDKPKNIDQDDGGADNKTEELAAKEDDPLAADGDKKENEQNSEDKKEDDADDMENADERDREDKNKDTEEQSPEKIDDRADSEGEFDDEKMDDDAADGTDNEDEDNETVDGSNVEERMDTEDQEPDGDLEDEENNPSTEVEDEKDEGEAMEEGTGGEKREQTADQEGGGLNEDEDEEEKEEQTEGKGQSKSDDKGEEGAGSEAKEKVEDDKEEDEETAQEHADKERELATSDEPVEEADEGQGEENETGKNMEDAPAAQKQIVGAGSMEEARQTKKENRKELERKKKTPLVGAEEQMDVPTNETQDDGQETHMSSAIHLAADDMFSLAEEITKELILGESQTENNKEETSENKISRTYVDAEKMWLEISRSVNILSAELAENLRLILEPQRANKMQGDYRSGKRLNMRRLIPYIASDYRKDRIWMRRTKRAQRDYQVLIAVDDSASMNENGIHKVTCESVCTIDDALRRCDAGDVAVCSFGSSTETLCSFGDQTIPGPELLQKLTFSQESTDLLKLLENAKKQLADVKTPSSEQLLIIISDGRGALSQGAEKVRRAVAALQGVTVLFVILDSGPKSISELTVASFQGGSVVLTPYLSLFPFPFYAVVKAIHQLPAILSESIRQWFELSIQSS